eukprot:UN02896
MNAEVLLGESVYGDVTTSMVDRKIKSKSRRSTDNSRQFICISLLHWQTGIVLPPALYDLPKFEESHRQFFDLLSQTSGKIILGSGDWHLPPCG